VGISSISQSSMNVLIGGGGSIFSIFIAGRVA
jgi:hypothetical protein